MGGRRTGDRLGPVVRAGLLAAASMLFFFRPSSAGVVINEIGYHLDRSSDTGKEWVELYNPDSCARDLSGYDLHVGRSPHYLFPSGFTLSPRSYVVVHLRLAGTNSVTDLFEGTAPTENMPNTRASVALFTSAARDTIVDFLQYGAGAQTYEAAAANDSIWTRGTFADTVPCGQSLGLAVNGVDSNRAADWTGYARPTPGYSNNPPPCDVAVVSLGTEPFAVPALREFRLTAVIANRGAGTARRTAVTVFSDDDRDSVPGASDRVFYQGMIDTIGASCSLSCVMPGMAEGSYALGVAAACSSDAYPWNDVLPMQLTAGSPLAINEIMYGPASGQPEWVELYNRSTLPIDLHGWTIEDLSAAPRLIDTAHSHIPPLGYAVVTQTAGLPWAPCHVLKPPSGLPSLSNDSDAVCIRDGRGVAVDRVVYHSTWGGGGNTSLERINPFLAPQEQYSWGGCVAAARATPGAPNSVYIERPAAGAALDLAPNPFSPDNDGYEDNLIISLRLAWARAAVTIRVYDRLGRLVRTIAQGQEVAGTTDLAWNGRDDQKQSCPMGLYVVSLEARDANGDGAVKKTRTVAIARKL